MARTLEAATIPVLVLSPGPQGALVAEGRAEDLAREIDAVVRAAGGTRADRRLARLQRRLAHDRMGRFRNAWLMRGVEPAPTLASSLRR